MIPELYQLQTISLSPRSTDPATGSSEFHLIESAFGPQLFVADGSRLYGIDSGVARVFRDALRDEAAAESLLGEIIKPPDARAIRSAVIDPPPLRSLSLNVAQTCNMTCSYCYADEGRFGGRSRMTTKEVAFQAIDRLLQESNSDEPVVVGFMGGEPLLNRSLVHSATYYAVKAACGRPVRFSLTTNGTLISDEDARLFHEFPFTVQISIDGTREANDQARPMRGGGSSYDRILYSLQLFQKYGRPGQLSARVTVTPLTRNLPTTLQHLLDLGFDDVGFAPVLVSPNPQLEFSRPDFESFLEQMKTCGRTALAELLAGRSFPFSNFTTALDEIHRGTHRPFPCGAGAAYLSVNAEGNLFACHRLIDDPIFGMGSVTGGLDHTARTSHLARMHVDRMEPCKKCWARYLCGGGCYHEVSRRGRPGCDYIRGWIEFCIASYVELSSSSGVSRNEV